jgi:hypothetical protein
MVTLPIPESRSINIAPNIAGYISPDFEELGTIQTGHG